MSNEQKRYKSHIQRLQSEVHLANTAMDKIRRWRGSKSGRAALEERDSTIADLRSLLERHHQELDGTSFRWVELSLMLLAKLCYS
jgi:hypothetical protein